MLLQELFEARQTVPNVSYSFKEVKGQVLSITVKLEKNKSSAMTRLASRYKEVDAEMKKLQEERDSMNIKVKSELLEYFDAEDAVLTRIVETVSLTAQLSKQSQDSTKVDDTAVIAKLLENATPELAEQIAKLREQCTSIVKAKSSALTVKINEGIFDGIKNTIIKFAKSVMTWAKGYDRKLDKIRAKLNPVT